MFKIDLWKNMEKSKMKMHCELGQNVNVICTVPTICNINFLHKWSEAIRKIYYQLRCKDTMDAIIITLKLNELNDY